MFSHLFDYFLLGFNSYIRKSTPVEDRVEISKWTFEYWKVHDKWLQKNAAPKKPMEPQPIVRRRKPLSEFQRLDELAKPKKRYEFMRDPSKISKAAKMYEATERITNLASPKKRRSDAYEGVTPFKVSRAALKHKPSERTAYLAIPREKKIATTDPKERPFEVAPEALKARATERTRELATPKRRPPKEAFDPFKVTAKALNAKTTKRILELSTPKKVKLPTNVI